MRFEVSGHQEFLVKTKSGFTTDSVLRVLQLLRDKSPDDEIRSGASLMIAVIAKSIHEIQSIEVNQVMLTINWLIALADQSKKRRCFWFICAFVNEILPEYRVPKRKTNW